MFGKYMRSRKLESFLAWNKKMYIFWRIMLENFINQRFSFFFLERRKVSALFILRLAKKAPFRRSRFSFFLGIFSLPLMNLLLLLAPSIKKNTKEIGASRAEFFRVCAICRLVLDTHQEEELGEGKKKQLHSAAFSDSQLCHVFRSWAFAALVELSQS